MRQSALRLDSCAPSYSKVFCASHGVVVRRCAFVGLCVVSLPVYA